MPSNRYAMLDFDLGAEIDQLRDTVRGFADDEIAPLAAEIDRSDKFPRQLWPKMGALGLHGVTVEECPTCHGTWLDANELETVAQRERDSWLGRLFYRPRR